MSSSSVRTAAPHARFALTSREQSKYSIARAILAAAAELNGGLYDSHCFEMEVSATIEKTIPPSVKRHNGIFIPYSLAVDPKEIRAGLDTKTTTKGKELVFTEPGPFVEYLYARMVVRALGAEVLDGLQGNVGFPKQTGKATGAWIDENPGVDVADSNLTLAQILMTLHTFAATTSFSRQLLTQSTPRIDAIVSLDLARDSALALDKAALIGDGTSGSPSGIMSTVGTQVYTLAGDTGDGALPVYADIIAMEELISDVNADTLQSFGFVTTAPVRSLLKQTPRTTTIALPVWDGDECDRFVGLVTNQLPRDGTEGTGTNLSPLIFGAWDTIALGLWGDGFELVVDPYRLKKKNMIETTSFLLCDVAVRQPVAFVVAEFCAAS